MNQDELNMVFDKQAESYDAQWERMSPVNAHILCVGAGTGREVLYLAKQFPEWQFMVLEPAANMMDICQKNVERAGLTSRCEFHQGYLDSLSNRELFDGTTCFLVSQFILDKQVRIDFYHQIYKRLKPEGLLVNTELAADTEEHFEELLPVWLNLMSGKLVSAEMLNTSRAAYAKDVAILPSTQVQGFMRTAGFHSMTQFFQAGLMHGWVAKV